MRPPRLRVRRDPTLPRLATPDTQIPSLEPPRSPTPVPHLEPKSNRRSRESTRITTLFPACPHAEPKEGVSITRTYSMTEYRARRAPRQCSRPIVEVRESERGDERKTGEADGQASIGRRALLFECLLPLRVRLGRDAFLLWGRNVRIDLYIPDGLQSVHAVKNAVRYSLSVSQS